MTYTGIHMSDIPSFSYQDLSGERVLCSVANLTCRDGWKFLKLITNIPVESSAECYSLEQVNDALVDLKNG